MKQSGNSQPTRLGVVTPYEGMRATFAMVVVFYRVNPVRMVTVLSMVFIAGLLEGFSLLSFLPVLAVVTGEAGGEVSSLNNAILEAVEVLGFGSSLATLLSLMVFAVTCKAILTYWALRLSAAAAVDYAAELRRGMFQALMRADWQFYTKQSSGRLSNAITQEASQASSSYSAFVTLA
ncbi:MAG: ABC transporter transmembrane domain-containing protein, partial [Pseudomonadota bacterium]